MDVAGEDLQSQLRALRARADDEFRNPSPDRPAGRHQLDAEELGLRVSITRSRYPNRSDGVDQYAVTISRPRMDQPPPEREVRLLLAMAFDDVARLAVERSRPSSPVRMFRLPAG